MKIAACRALRHRNFRLIFCGQSVAPAGTWMTVALCGAGCLFGAIWFAAAMPRESSQTL